jgi:hypothetical protein
MITGLSPRQSRLPNSSSMISGERTAVQFVDHIALHARDAPIDAVERDAAVHDRVVDAAVTADQAGHHVLGNDTPAVELPGRAEAVLAQEPGAEDRHVSGQHFLDAGKQGSRGVEHRRPGPAGRRADRVVEDIKGLVRLRPGQASRQGAPGSNFIDVEAAGCSDPEGHLVGADGGNRRRVALVGERFVRDDAEAGAADDRRGLANHGAQPGVEPVGITVARAEGGQDVGLHQPAGAQGRGGRVAAQGEGVGIVSVGNSHTGHPHPPFRASVRALRL